MVDCYHRVYHLNIYTDLQIEVHMKEFFSDLLYIGESMI